MSTEWPMESKRLEALMQAVRYAKQRREDLRISDPEDAAEWAVVADTISTEGGMVEGRDLWPTAAEHRARLAAESTEDS
ncbi:MAG: hypothetical protein ABW022_08375 [Actinoplanes sp.]